MGAGAAISTNLGQEHFHTNAAPYFRRRLTGDRVVQSWVTMSESRGDTVEYWFRVRQEGPSRSPILRATGERAQLTLESRGKSDRFVVMPLAEVPSVRDVTPWQVDPGTYDVALVSDSLYEVCRMPCIARDTVKLKPSSKVIWPR